MSKTIPLMILSLALGITTAEAKTFHETDSTQEFTAARTGYYEITSWGAPGGSVFGPYGGLGAEVSATFLLAAGDRLNVIVGGPGIGSPGYGAGGGGGSWVYDASLLEVAGGGGGDPYYNPDPVNVDGQGFGGSGMGGGTSSGIGVGGGGAGWLTSGAGGYVTMDMSSGAGGAGAPTFGGGVTMFYYGDDSCGPDPDDPEPCVYLVATGGYGGGGGAGYNGGGGGGGYSGGDGGADMDTGGIGGTSYAAPDAKDAVAVPGVSTRGEVMIQALPTPEPSSWATMVLGVGLLGAVARARRDRTAVAG
jgi:hypothetical protein